MFTSKELEVMREDQENINFANVATCRIFRYDPDNETFDPNTMERDLGPEEVVYHGKVFIQPTTRTYERMFTQGEERAISRTYILRIPVTAENVYINDTVYIEESPDPFFEGFYLTLIDVQGSSHSIDRRMIAELNLG